MLKLTDQERNLLLKNVKNSTHKIANKVSKKPLRKKMTYFFQNYQQQLKNSTQRGQSILQFELLL